MSIETDGCGEEYLTKEGYKICSGINRKWGIYLLCPKCEERLSQKGTKTSEGENE